MAKKGNVINGWLVIDKKQGMTSTDVVRALKRSLQPAKIGHAGTLDPLASGVLPVALGEATKTIPYLLESTKDYIFTVRFGEERDTDDVDGQVTARSEKRPRAAEIRKALPAFIGSIRQVPPRFSAVKVSGQRAYALARAGEAVELKERPVRIEAFELLETGPGGAYARFRVTCGSGTYIRALARDLGRALGSRGCIEAIRRTRVGPFAESHAISLDNQIPLGHSAPALEALLPVITALDDIPALAVTEGEAARIRRGEAVKLPTTQSGTVRITSQGALVALAEVGAGTAKAKRVFNL
ncbi:MAG TPA: tRNA pseudouridine(55) synthase TruB [Sphingomonadales bacterium]|nr:tRNA pseudouridine(55) synthase TruB [Sphingomonadales bacterium]